MDFSQKRCSHYKRDSILVKWYAGRFLSILNTTTPGGHPLCGGLYAKMRDIITRKRTNSSS
jgi:hypothetical protein